MKRTAIILLAAFFSWGSIWSCRAQKRQQFRSAPAYLAQANLPRSSFLLS